MSVSFAESRDRYSRGLPLDRVSHAAVGRLGRKKRGDDKFPVPECFQHSEVIKERLPPRRKRRRERRQTLISKEMELEKLRRFVYVFNYTYTYI